jgi:hypothetical protein
MIVPAFDKNQTKKKKMRKTKAIAKKMTKTKTGTKAIRNERAL